MITREELTLKAGDNAAIETHGASKNDYEIVTVLRVTPTGRFVVSGSVERTFYKDGREVGAASYRGFYRYKYLVPLTEGIQLEVWRKQLTHINWWQKGDKMIEDVVKTLGWLGE